MNIMGGRSSRYYYKTETLSKGAKTRLKTIKTLPKKGQRPVKMGKICSMTKTWNSEHQHKIRYDQRGLQVLKKSTVAYMKILEHRERDQNLEGNIRR